MPRKLMLRDILAAVLVAAAMLASCSPRGTPTQSAPQTATQTAGPSPTSAPASATPTSEPTPTPVVFAAQFIAGECPYEIASGPLEGQTVVCGEVAVPEDHANPRGPVIHLAVAVVKDQSDDHQPDPVFLLCGGPGQKCLSGLQGLWGLLEAFHNRRDLVVFDQRGTGFSRPALSCPEWNQAFLDILDESDREAGAKILYDGFMSCRDRLVKEGANLAAYTTAQNAADVDAIRQALGYEQINLYGGSYGSNLAQAVMRDFPGAVRSAVIDSVYPLEKSIFVDISLLSQNAILKLVEACAADQACNQAYPNLKEVLFEVIDRLNADPVPIMVTNPSDNKQYPALLDGDTVLSNLFTFLYAAQVIPALPKAIYDVYNGDYRTMTLLTGAKLSLLEAVDRGMMLSVMCTDDLAGESAQDYLDNLASLPSQLRGLDDPETVMKYGVFGLCQNWPVRQSGIQSKQPLVSELPTLILEGEFDPITPPEYGKLVADNLRNGYYYEFPGASHSVYATSQCGRAITEKFLDDPTREPEASCVSESPKVQFELPVTAAKVELAPFKDEQRGFQGLVPAGWKELAPANMARSSSALDPAYFVLEAVPGKAEDLFANLVAQLKLDPAPEPVGRKKVGSFTWDFYSFDRRGNPADLAIAQDGGKAYFVFLVSPAEERETLYQDLFLPAVEAMASL